MTPSMFEVAPIDFATLHEMSANSLSLEAIQRGGFRSMCKSSDLFEHGYAIIHWFRVSDRLELIEYRSTRGEQLPRVTITTYDEQCRFHEAIGVRVVSAGRDFKRSK